jgi:hypothetical protein
LHLTFLTPKNNNKQRKQVMRYVIAIIAFFTPSRASVEPTVTISTVPSEIEAIYLPADYDGPVVAAPVDDHVFVE